MGVKELAKNGVTMVKRNSPGLLLGIGLIGMGVMAYRIATDTRKYDQLRAKKKEELQTDILPVKEEVKTVVSAYKVPIILGASSAACIVMSSHINNQRIKLLAGGLQALNTAYLNNKELFNEYSTAVKNKIGEKKEEQIRNSIAQGKVDKFDVDINRVFDTGYGDTLFQDAWTGVRFISSTQAIADGFSVFSDDLKNDLSGELTLADLYDRLHINLRQTPKNMEYFGFKLENCSLKRNFGEKLVPYTFTSTFDQRIGKPVAVLEYNPEYLDGSGTFVNY